MSDLITAQRQALETWATQAIDAGWLNTNAPAVLANSLTAAPAQLFGQGSRPLVAGLFGGTGVGKSTLLNRLAGESIAHASAERPTSRDITVYVHRSISVDNLPESLPMQRMRTALHGNDDYRHVMFIDMPDFDSVEVANRSLVDLWLPHLDVVLYVVSPERYRDDQGWRLLLQHAHQHAWLFVMNHWDRGDPAQLDDFKGQLANAGLSDPLLFRSDSSALSHSGSGDTEDDFSLLQSTLITLSDQSIVESLNEHGILSRLKSLKSDSDKWLCAMSNDAALEELPSRWLAHWEQASVRLNQSLTQKKQAAASLHAENEGSWLSRLRGKKNPAPVPAPTITLIDNAFLDRIDNSLEDFLNQQSQGNGLPLAALKQSVAQPYAVARRDFSSHVDSELTASLALPGNRWQRGCHKLLGLLCVLLPLASMGWIAWRVVNGFAAGGSNPAAYLGSNFAINGAMLLALSWLAPAFAQSKVRPSREKAALRGIEKGLTSALEQVNQAVGNGFATVEPQAQNLRAQYEALWRQLAQPDSSQLPKTVQRMLAQELSAPVQRSLDVRANTHSSTDLTPVS